MKNGQRTRTDISPKMIYKRPINTLRCSTSLIIREMQIKIQDFTVHFTPIRMTISKSLQTIHAGEGVEKREPSYTVGGNVNWYSHYGE